MNQPAARIVGQAFGRPLQAGRDERVLDGIFGRGEVAITPNDGAEHLRRELAQQVLGPAVERCAHANSGGGPLMTCRTSIAIFIGTPFCPGAADASAAIWYARSGLSTSMIQ